MKGCIRNKEDRMFREMRRWKQSLTQEECVALLQSEKRGVLSVLGDDGYPYGIPMNFWYCPEDGHIYFHCSKQGHKIDAISRCDKVSFCTHDQGFRRDGEWAWNVKSVVIFGRIRAVEDYDHAMEAARQLGNRYTTDTAYVEKEIVVSGPNVRILELIPEHMTGKLVNES